jgi:hypothetical protein
MDYLIYSNKKINFYRIVLSFRPRNTSLFSAIFYLESPIIDRIINYGLEVLFLLFLLSFFSVIAFGYTLYIGARYFQINTSDYQPLLNSTTTYLNNFSHVEILVFNFFFALGDTILLIFAIILIIEIVPVSILRYFFYSKKGFIDMSDIPISFITIALQQLDSFDFAENFDIIQYKKIQISNLIYSSKQFIEINKDLGYPDYMNFYFNISRDLQSFSAYNDIVSRLNGLNEEVNETLIKINHMNSPIDKNKIKNDLEKYLKVIKTKDLSTTNSKEFVQEEHTLDKTMQFFFKKVFLPLILVLIAQSLIK